VVSTGINCKLPMNMETEGRVLYRQKFCTQRKLTCSNSDLRGKMENVCVACPLVQSEIYPHPCSVSIGPVPDILTSVLCPLGQSQIYSCR
jgi:hypothetical protein